MDQSHEGQSLGTELEEGVLEEGVNTRGGKNHAVIFPIAPLIAKTVANTIWRGCLGINSRYLARFSVAARRAKTTSPIKVVTAAVPSNQAGNAPSGLDLAELNLIPSQAIKKETRRLEYDLRWLPKQSEGQRHREPVAFSSEQAKVATALRVMNKRPQLNGGSFF
ncbi:hypothetical protein [Novipirellula galeiformis]|uniref:hypothetical protein n=1 Tax=Novipirellula galeiformis TaxID=2528004 RepID=UPI0011B826EC|nr:hypothetical protein [Novipirellula galeiformis]